MLFVIWLIDYGEKSEIYNSWNYINERSTLQ